MSREEAAAGPARPLPGGTALYRHARGASQVQDDASSRKYGCSAGSSVAAREWDMIAQTARSIRRVECLCCLYPSSPGVGRGRRGVGRDRTGGHAWYPVSVDRTTPATGATRSRLSVAAGHDQRSTVRSDRAARRGFAVRGGRPRTAAERGPQVEPPPHQRLYTSEKLGQGHRAVAAVPRRARCHRRPQAPGAPARTHGRGDGEGADGRLAVVAAEARYAIRRTRLTDRPLSSSSSGMRLANSVRCDAARWASRSSPDSQFS